MGSENMMIAHSSISIHPEPTQRIVSGNPDIIDPPLAAVVVRNAWKGYAGIGQVVKGLNLTVHQGKIYSLLGSSGCGKSTTLSCIVGLDKFTSGDVWLFEKNPGSTELGIPGSNVGYMPQDYSLYNQFTIMETFKYFGSLNGMDAVDILSSLEFFTNLLQLPKRTSRIGELSGGQRRRVSFAISLQHLPPLVILDEPTVGVDAIIRERIWNHLVEMTMTRNTTVIITTHYIEEARHSDRVGIMNDGKLIAEDSPSKLMEKFETNSLETVVLQLARNNKYGVNIANLHQSSDIDEEGKPPMAHVPSQVSAIFESQKRIRALIYKNATVAIRSLMNLFIIISVPCFTMFTYFIGVGNIPKSINFGAVNDDFNTTMSCYNFKTEWKGTCSSGYFSCKYLNHLSASTFNLKDYQSREKAEKAVMLGHITGFIYFPPEFSFNFYERAVSGLEADPDTFNNSNIVARLDESNSITAGLLKFELFSAFEKFVRDLLTECGHDPIKAEFPLKYKDPPILGDNTASFNFREYLIPSIFTGTIYFWPIVSSGILYVSEKRDGTIERSQVAGIQMWEIFLAYSVTEFFISIFRILFIYVMIVCGFKFNIVGSIWLLFLLAVLTNYLGVAVGFVLGSFCTEEVQVALLAIATFLPNMFLTGMHWPVEGMPVILQKISNSLPLTMGGEAMRSIANRGWELSHPNVWPGFVATFGYTMLFFILSFGIICMKSGCRL